MSRFIARSFKIAFDEGGRGNEYGYVVKLVWTNKKNMKTSFNPIFLWLSVMWCASKLAQWYVQGDRTVWEAGWNWFLDVVGRSFFV